MGGRQFRKRKHVQTTSNAEDDVALSPSVNSAPRSEEHKSVASKFFANGFVQGVAVFIALAVALSGKFDIRGTAVALLLAAFIGSWGIYTHFIKGRGVWVTVWCVVVLAFYGYLTNRPEGLSSSNSSGNAQPSVTEACDTAMQRLLAEYADKYPKERSGLLSGNLRPPTDWMNEKLRQQGSPCVTTPHPIAADSQQPPFLLKNGGTISGVTIDGGTVTNDGNIRDSNISLKDWFAYKLKKEQNEKSVDAAIEERRSMLEKQMPTLSPSERLQRMDEFEQAQLQLDAVKSDPEKLRSLVDTWNYKK